MSMMRKTVVVLVAVGCVVAFGGPVRAAAISIDTSDGSGADSYVKKGNATTNYGAATQIVVKDSGSGSTTRKGYLRFDVASPGGYFTDATLTLDVNMNNSGGGDSTTPRQFTIRVHGLKDGDAGEDWAEGGITWNNAPANATGNNKINADAVLLGEFIVPAELTPTVTFSAGTLNSFLNADTDGRATLILTRQGGNGSYNLSFAPKEEVGFNAPTLSGNTEAGTVSTVTTNDGNGADSYVKKGDATTNYGNAVEVLTKNAGSGTTTRKGYFRFDLASIGTDILDAYLELDVRLNNAGGGSTSPVEQVVNVFGLVDGDSGENWGETAITWNNAPANNTGNNGLLGNAVPLGQFTVRSIAAPEEILFSSPELIEFLSADTNDLATLILTRQSSNGSWNLGYASGEEGQLRAPSLTVIERQAGDIPEPATMCLAALGLAGLGGYIRRRKTA